MIRANTAIRSLEMTGSLTPAAVATVIPSVNTVPRIVQIEGQLAATTGVFKGDFLSADVNRYLSA
jgi:hypothetical protein